jgi:hypothetical protein
MYPHVGVDATGLNLLRQLVRSTLEQMHSTLEQMPEVQELIHTRQKEMLETVGGRWLPIPVLAPASLTPAEQRMLQRLPNEPWVLEQSAEAARTRLLANGDADGVAVLVGELGLRGEHWQEAFGVALIEDWQVPRWALPGRHLCNLLTEARLAHQQLTPLWRRRVRGKRVLLLDTPLGDGATLYDLVPDAATDYFQDLTDLEFEETRLTTVLNGLDPRELKVARAFAYHGTASWAEAAACAGEPNPEAFGERVRRKLKRLSKEASRRRAQQRTCACNPWLPTPKEERA